jgi:O-antigen ligase
MVGVTGALLPSYFFRYHLGPLPTTVLENLILVTAAIYAYALITERRMPTARSWLDIPIALLLVAGLVGIAVAPDHTRAVGIYRAYFIEAIAMYYIAVDVIRTREDLRLVLAIMAVGMSLFALGQVGRFAEAVASHSIEVDNGPAFLNTSANAVAMFLEPALAFAVAFVLYGSGARQRWVALACSLLLFVAMLLTLSRASYLSMAALAVVLVVTLPNPRWRIAAIAALAVIALVVIELPIFSQRLGTFAHSVQLRTSIYSQALKMLAQRPITGAGFSGFPVRVAPFRPGSQEIELYPHNLWLTTWSELGLLGLGAFAVIFFGLLWRGWRSVSRLDGAYLAAAWGVVGTLVLYLVHGLFDSPYWKNDLSVEFWLVAAFATICARAAAGQALRAGAAVQSRSSSA